MGVQGHLADQAPFERAAKRWFDAHLRTRPGPARSLALAAIPHVLLLDQGSGEGWRGPCSGTAVVPATPADVADGTSIAHDAGDPTLHDALDQRLAPFSAAFVGVPLEQPLTITGPLAVHFTAQTTGTDADWTARVVDVAPDGATRVVGRGWLKASHRREDPTQPDRVFHTHTEPERLVPGQPYGLAAEVWPTAYRLGAGHRLGVLLGAADTQKVLPTGESGASEIVVTPDQPATITVPVRAEAGQPLADPIAPLPPPPANDTESCRPAIGRPRLTTDGTVARVSFQGERAVAETLSRDGRVLARHSVAPGDVIWDGRDADGAPAPTGRYVVRLTAPPVTA